MGIHYTLYNNIKIGAYYRFIRDKQLDDSYSSKHRYYFDAAIKQKIKKFSLQFRYRFQSQWADIYSSESGKIPQAISRYKFTVRFLPDKLFKPFLAIEAFHDPEEGIFDKMRYVGGIEYELDKQNMINVFYLIQKEINVKAPLSDFIIGTGYDFKFWIFSSLSA